MLSKPCAQYENTAGGIDCDSDYPEAINTQTSCQSDCSLDTDLTAVSTGECGGDARTV